MKPTQTGTRQSEVPKEAVLLIPEPETNEPPAHGIKPGYYDPQQMLAVLLEHKDDPDAIQFIADMLETGDAETDGFVGRLRANRHDPLAIARIVQSCRS